MSQSQSKRVAFFFLQARRAVRLAREHQGPTRARILIIANCWRVLAKDTRARWSR